MWEVELSHWTHEEIVAQGRGEGMKGWPGIVGWYPWWNEEGLGCLSEGPSLLTWLLFAKQIHLLASRLRP